MQREEHVVGETFSYRFPAQNPDHAILIQHGIASHGGIYDTWCAHHATHGVEVWSMDAPGHGRSVSMRPPGRFSLDEWVEAAVAMGDHIRQRTGLEVFVKGSSLGAAAAYCALQASDVFRGSILMGYAIPSAPTIPTQNPFRSKAFDQINQLYGDKLLLSLDRFINFDEDYGYKGAVEQKKADPLNTWFYELRAFASFFQYDPVVPLAENTKPILYTVGERDTTFGPELARTVADATAGPVELYVHPDGMHQLMLSHTEEYSEVVLAWCRGQVGHRIDRMEQIA
jgi:pimeloyl-ACP methyl ester carboxylesterase